MSYKQKVFHLLGTDGCHLCDVAAELLAKQNITYQKLDIVDDPNLVEFYGEHIPVFIAENAEQALFWPFNQLQLEQYISHYGIN